MKKISDAELMKIAESIVQKIKDGFKLKHMSKNLINTMEIIPNKGSVEIVIPAKIYNMYQFQRSGIILHHKSGSYASFLNDVGSEFMIYPSPGQKRLIKPHNHIGYVDKAMESALEDWLAKNSHKYELKSREDV